MIETVTFNPAIDKTAQVEKLIVGGLNRLSNVRQDAGGKGINVSKTIQALGGNSLCTGFLAGSAGSFITEALDERKIAHDFVWVEGNTRTNLKVLNADMELTELNEAGPAVHDEDIAALLDKISRHAGEDTLVVLSGNVSPGVPDDIYKTIIEHLREKNIQAILDADGKLFANGVQARPLVIKPNRFELAQYYGMDENISNETVIELASRFLNEDTRLVVVSMGIDGSIFITRENVWIAKALKIDFLSAVGAGDAMVAAIAYGLDAHLDMEELIALAVAASGGACMTEGTQPADFETVCALKERVEIEKVKR